MNDQKIVEMDVSEIRLLPEIQSRVDLDEDAIAEFAEKIENGEEFPPIIVFRDGEEWVCADGFHRVHAARKAEVEKIDAEVREGNRRDAILHSVGANTQHGVRRTNADKRRAVEMLLSDSEWLTWSDGEIARRVAVSQPFVSKLRKEFTHNGYESPPVRRTADGRLVDTTKIGKPPRREAASNASDPGQDNPEEEVAEADDPEQSNAPTPPSGPEEQGSESDAAHGWADDSGDGDSNRSDVGGASRAADSERAVTEPVHAVTLSAAERAYVLFAADKALQIQTAVEARSIGAVGAQAELTDLGNLVHGSLRKTRDAVNRTLQEARTAVTSMAHQTLAAPATGDSPTPTPEAARPDAASP